MHTDGRAALAAADSLGWLHRCEMLEFKQENARLQSQLAAEQQGVVWEPPVVVWLSVAAAASWFSVAAAAMASLSVARVAAGTIHAASPNCYNAPNCTQLELMLHTVTR